MISNNLVNLSNTETRSGSAEKGYCPMAWYVLCLMQALACHAVMASERWMWDLEFI